MQPPQPSQHAPSLWEGTVSRLFDSYRRLSNLKSDREKFIWLATIRARLYLAFGFAATLTIIGSSVSYYEFVGIGTTAHRLVSHNLPATVLSLQLAEEASSLVSSAPHLITAQDDKSRSSIFDKIHQQAQTVAQHIDALKTLGIKQATEISGSSNALLERLQALNQSVTYRLQIMNERRDLTASIRPAHDLLVDALQPAIDDADFDLMSKSNRGGTEFAVSNTLESLRRLLEIQSEANLLAGLLTEASLVTDPLRLDPLQELIASAQRKISRDLSAIKNPSQRSKVTELARQLATIGHEDGIVALRKYELDRERDARNAFDAAQYDAIKLKAVVAELVEEQHHAAQDISDYAGQQLRSGKVILITLSVIAVLLAALVAWLYVGRNIIRRLALLGDAMRRIADGDVTIQIDDSRDDEIASMSRTLLFFRKATSDAASAREKEIQETKALEERRRLIDSATRDFEHAVANVAQTLDYAARELDSSANAMADSANRNEQQVAATAAASEEATCNAENVASGAEQIAQSIEHIAERVANSEAATTRAAQEAKAISGAVESLSKSVAEIGGFSALIREIAAQTNLLALNATIEAARAGESGRGFAVVAQEVKALATQAGNATEQITRQASSIEKTTSQCTNAMNRIAATILQLNDIASDVASAIRQQDSITQEIARNAGEAAKGTRDVSQNINEVSTTAGKTGQVASTVLTAAAQLSEQSHSLRHEVERYLSQIRAA
jgi:methyl-accepting chemotaxis protein